MKITRLAAAAFALAVPVTAAAQVVGTVTLRADLAGNNEVPAPPQATGAHGRAIVTVDASAGRITYRVEVYNLPSGLTGAHIHVGPTGSNGPIILDMRPTILGASNDFALEGSWTAGDLRPNAATGINSWDDAVTAIASGVTYVNVHSQVSPGGEIRGQLCPDHVQANRFTGVAACVAAPAGPR